MDLFEVKKESEYQLKERVFITGIGVVTPVGISKEKFFNALERGENGISKIESFDTSDYPCKIAAEIKDFKPEEFLDKKLILRADRFCQFALVAAQLALKDANLNPTDLDSQRTGVLIGSGIGGLLTIEREHKNLIFKGPRRVSPFLIPMLIINIASGQVAIQYKLRGPNSASVTACASSNHAIGEAFRTIQRGEADVMITGGAEAAITPLSLAGFSNMKALSMSFNEIPQKASRPFDKKRDGFVIGEGAGILILESQRHVEKRGAKVYAEVIGYGMTADAYHITAPDPDVKGQVEVMQKALKDANMQPEDVDYINAHGTSTPLNDTCETKAIKEVFKERAYQIPISSTKSMIGHLLGAAGGVELAACILALERNIIHPTINYEYQDPECDLWYVPNKAIKKEVKVCLSNAFGFGGQNATLIIRRVSTHP